MIRNCSLLDISDGRLYSENDMVRADCNDCEGCSACCQGMGGSIVLDPYDCYLLMKNLSCSFEELMKESIELHVVDGVILPNLKMNQEKDQCHFLNEEGRCSIHAFRPGICRLFPLGRYWDEQGEFHYILQTGECQKENKSKIKVKKWLDRSDLAEYDRYVKTWHDLLLTVRAEIAQIRDEVRSETPLNLEKAKAADNKIRRITMNLLQIFFVMPYEEDRDFYTQFEERLV